MKKLALSILALLCCFATAQAATVTLPSVTFSGSASSSISCQQASANFAVPVAAGTVIFNCTVVPSTWTGVITGNLNAPFAVSNLNGSTFSIILSSSVTVAGTVSAGSVSSAP